MSYYRDYSENQTRMLQVVREALVVGGLNDTLAGELSVDACDAITQEFCGELLYVSANFRSNLSSRNREIYAAHESGKDMNELVAAFNLSHPQISKILRKAKAALLAEKQSDMFP